MAENVPPCPSSIYPKVGGLRYTRLVPLTSTLLDRVLDSGSEGGRNDDWRGVWSPEACVQDGAPSGEWWLEKGWMRQEDYVLFPNRRWQLILCNTEKKSGSTAALRMACGVPLLFFACISHFI